MDITWFLRILWKKKWLILLAMVAAGLTTWFWQSRKPDIYKASVLISTGIVDYKGVEAEEGLPFVQKFQVDMNFSNLIEFIHSRPSVRFLSYHLLLHDLNAENLNGSPFRRLEEEEKEVFPSKELFTFPIKLKNQLDSLNVQFESPETEAFFQQLAKAYSYDEESLRMWNLKVNRFGNTDYLKIDFLSESPELSAFAVNHFCETFLRHRKNLKTADSAKKVKFLKDLVEEKREYIDRKKQEVKVFRENQGLIDLNAQQEAIVDQIKELEAQIDEEKKNIPVLENAIGRIEEYADSKGLSDFSTPDLLANDELLEVKQLIAREEVELATSRGLTTDERNARKRRIAGLREQEQAIMEKIAENTARDNERADLSDLDKTLLIERLEKEFDLGLARETVTAYQEKLDRMENRALNLVSAEALIRNLEDEIDYAQKEFGELRTKLSQAQVELEKSYQPLTIIEQAQRPEIPESSKKWFFVIFAALVAAAFLVGLFLLFYLLDNSVHNPEQFSRMLRIELLTLLPAVDAGKINLPALFEANGKGGRMELFREGLRSLRQKLISEKAGVYLFVSNRPREGKTFIMLNTAYALSMIGKKVLLIDTNFKNNTLSQMAAGEEGENALAPPEMNKSMSEELEFVRFRGAFLPDQVSVIGNKGSHRSPAEVFAGKDVKGFIRKLMEDYDFIFLEAAAMNDYSDARELIPLSDRIIAVFEAGHAITDADKRNLAYLREQNEKLFGGILNKLKNPDLS